MSGLGIQEGLAILTVAVAAAWLIRRRFIRRRVKAAGCSACAHAGVHRVAGAAPKQGSVTASTPTAVSSTAAADPRP